MMSALGQASDRALRHPKSLLITLSLLFFLPGLWTLPPLDRDESRFAQAAKQMLETGDFVEIKFQDRGRNKKPVGIYWLQALTAKVLGGPDQAQIWAYRLPSLFAAIIVVLSVHAIAARGLDPPGALTTGALMASTLLLVGEANIAKTDAALLASIVVAQLAAFQIYKSSLSRKTVETKAALVFWIALSIGTLIKGPVILMVCGLTLIALALTDRNAKWLMNFRPLIGIPLFLAAVLPWGIAVWMATDGGFFAEALGKDFGPKLVSGQESHGAPPGYYLLALHLTLWPAALFLWPSLFAAWHSRRDPLIRFCLAWALPTWIIFELVPTKLPHYILPTYPALILLIAIAVSGFAKRTHMPNKALTIVSLSLWAIVGSLFASALILLPAEYGGRPGPLLYIAATISMALILITIWFVVKGNWQRALFTSIACGLVFTSGLLEGVARQIPDLFVSPKIAAVLEDSPANSPITSAGFTEPSLVFLTQTDIRLGTGEQAAAFLARNPQGIALVEAHEKDSFLQALRTKNLTPIPFAKVDGLNYSRGDDVEITFYRLTLSRN